MPTLTRSRTIESLTVADAMHRGVLTCEREAPLSEVARTMAARSVHCVVVEAGSGDSGPIWGVVSDLDLVAAATVRDLDEQTAGGSATTAALMIPEGESLQRAAQLMMEHGSRHLVVVDAQRVRPIGVLSTLDIAGALAREE